MENLQYGFEAAEKESKPIMLILHSTSCEACVKLRRRLVKICDDLKVLSQEFIMVDGLDGEDKPTRGYGPDGYYIPRFENIFFLIAQIATFIALLR